MPRPVLDTVVRWAAGRRDVRGLALAGSWARGRRTAASDVDLVLLTDDPRPYVEGEDWAEELGAALLRTRTWGRVTERRLALPGAPELDLGIAATDWASTAPVDPGTARVVADGLVPLLDPDGALRALVRFVRRDAPASKPLPDVGGPGLRVLFCGINPSLISAERGHHFARPGNRFWPALHGAGLTPRRLAPEEDGQLPRYGLGITNLVSRPTRAADELDAEELREGARELEAVVARWRPELLAVVGITAYRGAFARPGARLGPQPETVSGTPVWVLPNPSGLNAHHQLPELIRLFGELQQEGRRSLFLRPE